MFYVCIAAQWYTERFSPFPSNSLLSFLGYFSHLSFCMRRSDNTLRKVYIRILFCRKFVQEHLPTIFRFSASPWHYLLWKVADTRRYTYYTEMRHNSVNLRIINCAQVLSSFDYYSLKVNKEYACTSNSEINNNHLPNINNS